MKRILSLFLTLAMSMAVLTACGTGGASVSTAANAGSGGAASGDSGYDTLHITAAHGAAESTTVHKAWLKFKELVEAGSGGAVTVDIYPNQQMGGDSECIASCQQGNLTMDSPSTSPLAAFDPTMNTFETPFLFSDRDTVYSVLDSDAGQEVLDSLEASGLKGLGYFENGFRELTCNKEINSLADLKGLKIRVMENDVQMAMWKAMGANPTPMAFGDIYTALQQKTVDAQENPLELINNTKFYEVQDHVYMTNHIYTAYVVFMNLDTWNSLNSKTQDLIQDCVKQATDYQRGICKQAEQDCMDAINASGSSKVYEVSDDLHNEMVQACSSVYDMVKKLAGNDITEKIYAAAGFNG